jgi:hypothetical protein
MGLLLISLIILLTPMRASGESLSEDFRNFPGYRLGQEKVSAGLNEPEFIDLTVTPFRRSGSRRVDSRFDIHLQTDVPFDALIDIFLDNSRFLGTLPRLVDYEWDVLLEDEHVREVRERQVISITFMGVTSGYDFVQRTRTEITTEDNARVFRLYYRLEDSLDGKLESSEGLYYVRETWHDQQPGTYIRQYNQTVIADVFPGLPLILRHLAPIGTRRIFESLLHSARSRER